MTAALNTLLSFVALALMLVAMVAAFVPFVPGPVLVWAVGIIYAVLTGFEQVTYLAAAVMTVFMVLGTTSDLWLQYVGVRTGGGSCLSAAGGLIGGVLGTLFIPVPLLGTLIGTVLGAAVMEGLRLREVQGAVDAGSTAFKMYLLGVAVEFASSVAIIVVYVLSVWGEHLNPF